VKTKQGVALQPCSKIGRIWILPYSSKGGEPDSPSDPIKGGWNPHKFRKNEKGMSKPMVKEKGNW